jgi:hypothetical protein
VNAVFCPQCGAKLASRVVPAGTGARRVGAPLWLIGAAAAGVGVFLYLFVDHLPGGDHPVIAVQPVVDGSGARGGDHADQSPVEARLDGDELVIPLQVLRDKRIVEFEYADGTVTVPLLAFITGEGKLVTAYRMCEPCNSKRFSIDGDRLSCGNCETQWSLDNLEGLQGTCQKYPPEPFPSRIDGDAVRMSVAKVKEWKIRL